MTVTDPDAWWLKPARAIFKSGLSQIEKLAIRKKGIGLIFSTPILPVTQIDAGVVALVFGISYQFLTAVNPTLNFQVENIAMLPVLEHKTNSIIKKIDSISKNCVELSKADWDSYETSWDFTSSPLFNPKYYKKTLKETYKELITDWQEVVREMQRLEEENNRIFIESYFLQNEISPEIPLSEITLTCNPHYRYGGYKSEKEQELLMRKDIIKEFISYAIGCMMGRYSIDIPGLVYAYSCNKGFDSSKYRTFPSDDDGIIPIMDQEWFPDDATTLALKAKRDLDIEISKSFATRCAKIVRKIFEFDSDNPFAEDIQIDLYSEFGMQLSDIDDSEDKNHPS